MFNLFDIAPKEKKQIIAQPVVVKAPVVEQSQPVVAKPTPFKRKPSAKDDAFKVMAKLMDNLEKVNNPKVDALRKLMYAIENNSNLDSVVAFYKEPIKAKKTKKKLISGKFY